MGFGSDRERLLAALLVLDLYQVLDTREVVLFRKC